MVLTGTAMSCLIEAPSRFWLSEMLSRNFHSAAAWAWLPATTASLATPSVIVAARPASKLAARLASCPPVASINTYQGDGAVSGSRVPSMWRVTKSSAMRGISSKADNMPPVRACISPSSVRAAAGDGTAAKAVTATSGLGNSLRVAAVMTPNVPSEPMNICLRS